MQWLGLEHKLKFTLESLFECVGEQVVTPQVQIED